VIYVPGPIRKDILVSNIILLYLKFCNKFYERKNTIFMNTSINQLNVIQND